MNYLLLPELPDIKTSQALYNVLPIPLSGRETLEIGMTSPARAGITQHLVYLNEPQQAQTMGLCIEGFTLETKLPETLSQSLM